MRDLLSITVECIQELKDIGIPIQDDRVNEVKFARLPDDEIGLCSIFDDNTFVIKIALFLRNEKIDINELKATVCHELIHTCKGCHNHRKPWIDYAKMADEIYGYGIFVQKSKYDIRNKEKKILHRMVCPECGGIRNIRKMCDWSRIQDGTKVVCVWCGSYCTIDFQDKDQQLQNIEITYIINNMSMIHS